MRYKVTFWHGEHGSIWYLMREQDGFWEPVESKNNLCGLRAVMFDKYGIESRGSDSLNTIYDKEEN